MDEFLHAIVDKLWHLRAGWQLSPVCITETFDSEATGLEDLGSIKFGGAVVSNPMWGNGFYGVSMWQLIF